MFAKGLTASRVGLNVKRIIAIFLVPLLAPATTLCGCAHTHNTKEADSKISVVCTIFPQYDWVRQILGDKAGDMDVTLLMSNSIDLHNYQPSVDDFIKITDCDLFIYVGGESDGWVDDALKQAANQNLVVINLLDTLGAAAKIEERDNDNSSGLESEYDEHVWLSLRNAKIFCAAIAEALSSLDADNAGTYKNNLAAYAAKLSALDSEYQTAINAAPVRTLLFGDRFPFRYLADDYGLDCFAAFAGCSAETEASFETIIFLTGKVDELGLKNIMVTESSDKEIAETIIRESKGSNQQILVMDAMQSVASSDIANGATYLSIMEGNLGVLKVALGSVH